MFNAAKCVAVAGALILGTSTANAVVLNGDFEDVSSSTPSVGLVNGNALSDLAGSSGRRSWDVYTSLPGWRTGSGAGIEVQSNGTLGSIDAHSGQHYIELDSHPRGNSNSSMEQDVTLGVGSYELSFWYSPRNSQTDSNGIDYSISDGLLAGSISGPGTIPQVTSVGDWSLVTARFMVDVAGDYTLSFAATGRQNTLGGFVDTVSIAAVPLPAAGLLLPIGFAVLVVAKRRRATS